MTDHAVPKPVADLGDIITDALLDAINQEPPELRDELHAAIAAGDYRAQRFPDREVVIFPRQDLQYDIAFVNVSRLAADRLN